MRGLERLAAVDRSTPPMAEALPSLPMAQTVMIRLMRISVVGLGQFFEPVFRTLGLTETSFHVLCLLMAAEDGRASPSELSDLVGTSRANMTRVLDDLIETGLVQRASSTRDARRAVIQITSTGRSVAANALPRLEQPLRRAFEDLSPDEFASLETLLRKVIRAFDKGAQPLRTSA